jgi:hypothetical protein
VIKLGLIELLAIILVIAWVGGLSLNVAGGLIHILLVLAVLLFLSRFLRRTV